MNPTQAKAKISNVTSGTVQNSSPLKSVSNYTPIFNPMSTARMPRNKTKNKNNRLSQKTLNT